MKIRAMTRAELAEVMLEWSREETWDYSPEDIDVYLSISSMQVYALVDDNEALVGCVCVSKYQVQETKIASIGLLIIKSADRGKGHGGYLLQNVINDWQSEDTIFSLNAVPKSVPLYKRHGFFHAGVSNRKYLLNIASLLTPLDCTGLETIRPIEYAREKATITDYDKSILGEIPGREAFVDAWYSRADAVLHASYNHGRIDGYGVLTKCTPDKYRLSPLYSSSIDITAKLLKACSLTAQAKGISGIEMDTHVLTPANTELLKELGFEFNIEGITHLMVTKRLGLNPNKDKVVALEPLEFPHALLATGPRR